MKINILFGKSLYFMCLFSKKINNYFGSSLTAPLTTAVRIELDWDAKISGFYYIDQ